MSYVDISDDNDEGVVDEKEEGIILSDEDQLIEGDTRENKQLRNNNEDDNAGSTEDNAKLLNMIAENVVGPDNSSKDIAKLIRLAVLKAPLKS